MKSVEMQIALPRTVEAGKYQDQMAKQNQRFQESLAQSQLQQQELQRKRLNELEQINHKNIARDDTSGNQAHEKEEKCSSNKETLEHPFLGRQFDFTR